MSSTCAKRLPEELRKKMRMADANWGEEIGSFIEEQVRCLELAQLIEEIGRRADERRLAVDATSLIRKTRSVEPRPGLTYLVKLFTLIMSIADWAYIKLSGPRHQSLIECENR